MGKAHRLTVKQVESAKPGTVLQDGAGLMLRTNANGAKRWILRVQVNGSRRDIGLGSFPVITLAKARAAALDVRRSYAEGRDPVQERREARKPVPTFRECADMVKAEHAGAWRSEKTAKHWDASLTRYAFPKLGDVKVRDITGEMVRSVLLPIWVDKPEVARKTKGRIQTVLNYAHSRGWRDSEAPRFISRGLPRQQNTVNHHRALPWKELPGFVANLSTLQCSETIRAALEFTLLTAARSGETRGATWAEADPEAKLWCIPGSRMKSGRAHRIPLSTRAVAILEDMAKLRTSDEPDALVFPGTKRGKQLSDMSLSMPLRRAGIKCTPHGFRSSFRTWCSEAASVPRELAERALAHVVADETERAYARGDMLERRATLMQRWADFLTTGKTMPENVSDLDEARRAMAGG